MYLVFIALAVYLYTITKLTGGNDVYFRRDHDFGVLGAGRGVDRPKADESRADRAKYLDLAYLSRL